MQHGKAFMLHHIPSRDFLSQNPTWRQSKLYKPTENLCLPPVSIFPASKLMMEAEASPAETTPLCLTKRSDTLRAELPSSTALGRPQSPLGSGEERSEVRKRSQSSSTYIRAKIKVLQERAREDDGVRRRFWLKIRTKSCSLSITGDYRRVTA